MSVRAFDLVGAADIRRCRESAAQALSQWRSAWGGGLEHAEIDCLRAWEAPEEARRFAAPWRRWSCRGGHAWAAATPTFAAQVHEALFGQCARPGDASTLAAEVVDEAVGDLVRCLFASLAPNAVCLPADAAAGLPAELFTRGSGAVVVSLDTGRDVLRVIVSGESGAARAAESGGARSAAQPLGETQLALRAAPVVVDAELGEIEIELGTLQSLEAGDVIRMETALDQAVKLSVRDGPIVCLGEFGMQHGFRALSLKRQSTDQGATK